ncbi:MAG: transcriptional regulator [Solobacterium sp.]|nr:transcriptional regulator [Solobacterium sp.]
MTEIRKELQAYTAMADMLVQTFGSRCEVVIHDLSSPEHSVVYVANGTVTGRKIGDSFDHLVRQVLLSSQLERDFVTNYYFETADDQLIRSSTILIRGSEDELAGAMCINLAELVHEDPEILPLHRLPSAGSEDETVDLYSDNVGVADMVRALVNNILGPDTSGLTRSQRIDKLRFMDAKGIFLVKGSIDLVAEKLGITKVTVYSYLDEIRGRR